MNVTRFMELLLYLVEHLLCITSPNQSVIFKNADYEIFRSHIFSVESCRNEHHLSTKAWRVLLTVCTGTWETASRYRALSTVLTWSGCARIYFAEVATEPWWLFCQPRWFGFIFHFMFYIKILVLIPTRCSSFSTFVHKIKRGWESALQLPSWHNGYSLMIFITESMNTKTCLLWHEWPG